MITPIIQKIHITWSHLRRADRLILGQIVIWIATMISLPIIYWTFDEQALQIGIEVGVLVQVAAVMVILARSWGVPRALAVGLLSIALAWLSEAIGTATGFPFGRYTYTQVLQPQILHVPLLIPMAWLMMLPPAWAAGWLLVGPTNRIVWAFSSAVAFTVWDLFLDPQMVAWGYWDWDQTGGYFGIPWVNFLGWLLVSFLVTSAVSFLFHPSKLPTSPLLVVYIFTWLLQTIGQFFFWNLPGSALVGFIGMGLIIAVIGFRRRSKIQAG